MGDTIVRNEKIETKSVTYSNTGATTTSLFTVTGDVIVRIIAVCTTSLTSGAASNMSVGITATTDAIIPSTLATDIDAREIWYDASPDSEIESLDTIRQYIVTDGNDIGVTNDAQVDTGALKFYCMWQSLGGNGLVVAA